MATVFSMDYQENPGPVLTLIAEAEELSVQSKHTRKQLNKLQAAADTARRKGRGGDNAPQLAVRAPHENRSLVSTAHLRANQPRTSAYLRSYGRREDAGGVQPPRIGAQRCRTGPRALSTGARTGSKAAKRPELMLPRLPRSLRHERSGVPGKRPNAESRLPRACFCLCCCFSRRSTANSS